MAKQPPRGRRTRADEEEASRSRLAPPPPAGLPVMPRPLDVDAIRDDGKSVVTIEATPAERAELAKAYGVPDVGALTARLGVVKRGKFVSLRGELKARVTQICVVTTDAFESDVEDVVEMEFAPEAQVAEAWERIAKAEASGTNAPVEDPPDVIVDGRIDLGAVTAEALALALDPYPKKPGVEFETPDEPEASADDSPFAALAKLKKEIGPGGA